MKLLAIGRDGQVELPRPGDDEHVGAVIEATVALYGRRGFVPPWVGYLALDGDALVGACGFAGPPAAGEVELAYFTFPGHEGRGIGRRMAAGLLALTRPQALQQGLRRIAHTLPQHGPSTRILAALGFECEGEVLHPEDGPVWRWCECPPPQGR